MKTTTVVYILRIVACIIILMYFIIYIKCYLWDIRNDYKSMLKCILQMQTIGFSSTLFGISFLLKKKKK